MFACLSKTKKDVVGRVESIPSSVGTSPACSPRSTIASSDGENSSAFLLPGKLTVSKQNEDLVERLKALRNGNDILSDPLLNKGSAFSKKERALFNLVDLDNQEESIDNQLAKLNDVWKNELQEGATIEKYIFLEKLHNENAVLYFKFLVENTIEALPNVYTPIVGQACTRWSELQSENLLGNTQGLYLKINEKNSFSNIINAVPQQDVDIIVVTDGSRILGLGDLGVNGMGIPVGKLALYVAATGFRPWRTLPVTLDFGTDTKSVRESANYIGLKRERPTSDQEFYDKCAEFVKAVKSRWPKALIQFEDFSTDHAFGLLQQYREDICCFNDDIQGTAGVVLAGLLAALRVQKLDEGGAPVNSTLREQRIVFFGAGSAGVGVAELIAQAMWLESVDAKEEKPVAYWRKNNFWLVDTKGLVVSGTKNYAHKIPFARDEEKNGRVDLLSVVKSANPTILLGLAGASPGAFNEEIVTCMDKSLGADNSSNSIYRPIIMALSNPTSKSECTAEEAYRWTDGRCLFASGSPFAPVTLGKKTFVPGQGNNMYIFPGIGYGAFQCQAKKITDSMFYEAAKHLANYVTASDLAKGSVYPDVSQIRNISLEVALGVCEVAEKEKLAQRSCPPEGWKQFLSDQMWSPSYEQYV